MPKKKSTPSPEPVPVNVVCSLCGEPWHLHQEVDGEITTLECIRLLKARPQVRTPYVIPQPYPVYPYRPWQQPWVTWTSGQTISGSSGSQTTTTINCSNTQPRVLTASAIDV